MMENAASLDRVDASRLDWGRDAAAHLLRRAGFMPTAREIDQAVQEGLETCVARFVDGSEAEGDRAEELNLLGEGIAARNDISSLRAWWIARARHTRHPLRARMALFWHNHFATSHVKVQSAALMLRQLRVIEERGMGRFRDLVISLARDPAMLIWLDGNANVKGRPNENFARELLELFTLGAGNYSETDIREAARAFTGWHTKSGRFKYSAGDHDDGQKRVLGREGPLTGEDVIDAALTHASCGRFIARKLLREFVSPMPSELLVESCAAELRSSNFEIGAFLKRLLTSEAFFDAENRGVRIKSPVELMIGILRSLEMSVSAEVTADACSDMGQRLFEPPSVKGWDGHRSWINSATMLVRLNAIDGAVSGSMGKFDASRALSGFTAQGGPIAAARMLTETGAWERREDEEAHSGVSDMGEVTDVFQGELRRRMMRPEYQMA